MENTIPVNSVNISLSEYNLVKANLEASRDLLNKTTGELNALRSQQTENKIVVLERKVWDGSSNNGYKTISKLEMNVKDPEVSKVILDTMSNVETTELETKITEKENIIRDLNYQIKSYSDAVEENSKGFMKQIRSIEETNNEKVRKLKRGYEDSILDLEIDKETLQKSLADLKKDKTQEQLELARATELQELNEKLDALTTFKDTINRTTNPFKLRSLLNSMANADKFVVDYPWFNKLRARTNSAMERVQEFARVIATVGQLPKRDNSCKKECQPVPVYYGNGFNGYGVYEAKCVAW